MAINGPIKPKDPKTQEKKEVPKQLPAYQPDNTKWLFTIFLIIAIIGIIYVFSQAAKIPPTPGPTGIPTISPSITATATPTAIILTPSATEEPIPTINQLTFVKCGTIMASASMDKDLTVDGSCFIIGAKDVTLDCNGFSISGKGKPNSTAVYTEYEGTIIKNCFINGFEIGVRFRGANSGSLLDSTLTNNLGGVLLESLSKATISGNHILNTTEVSIFLGGVKDSTIEGNFLDFGNKYGIQLVSSDGNTLRENSVYRNRYGLQLSGSGKNKIIGNNVSFNLGGIKTTRSSNNLFEANYVTDNTQVGLHILESSQNNIIRSNTVLRNEYGTNIRDSPSTTLDRNIICENYIEDVQCNMEVAGNGNTCFLRAIYCGFDCAAKCPTVK